MADLKEKQNIPQGWAEKDLLDCFFVPSKLTGVKQSQYEKSGDFPVFDQGQDYISGYSSDRNLLIENVPAILFGDHTRIVKYIKSPFVAGADGTKIFLAKDGFDSSFLYYLVSSQKIPNTGYNRHFKFFKDIKVVLPELKTEQQKIAEILRAVDEDIAKTQEVIEATEKFKRGLMQQLFTRGIGHTKFKETKIGSIPEAWEVGGFSNLVDPEDKNAIKPGPFGSALKKSFYVEKGYKIYGQEQVILGDATYGDYYVNEEKYNELAGFKVKSGDILISLVGTIGKILIVPENFEKGIINPRLLKITPDKNKANSEFVAHLLKSEFLIQQMNQKSHGGTMSILNKGMLMSVNFGVPPFGEQKEIAEILSAVDKKISVNKKLKEKLTLLKKGLMQDLLSGRVRAIIK